jgi:hypothetical protein
VSGHLFGVYLRNPSGGELLYTIVRAETAPEAVEAAQVSQAIAATPAALFPLVQVKLLNTPPEPESVQASRGIHTA